MSMQNDLTLATPSDLSNAEVSGEFARSLMEFENLRAVRQQLEKKSAEIMLKVDKLLRDERGRNSNFQPLH